MQLFVGEISASFVGEISDMHSYALGLHISFLIVHEMKAASVYINTSVVNMSKYIIFVVVASYANFIMCCADDI